jgi:hypothetical protein
MKHPKRSASDLFHCRLTVHEVTEETGISKTTCHEILNENLGMHCVATKFVPCLLSQDQKQNIVDVSNKLVDRLNADENVTGVGFTAVMSKQKPNVHNGSQKHNLYLNKHGRFSAM